MLANKYVDEDDGRGRGDPLGYRANPKNIGFFFVDALEMAVALVAVGFRY